MVNWCVDIGSQKRLVAEQLFVGSIEHDLNPSKSCFDVSPAHAAKIVAKVRAHYAAIPALGSVVDGAAITALGSVVDGAPKSPDVTPDVTFVTENKFGVRFGINVFREYIGHTDAELDALAAQGRVPASVMAAFIAFEHFCNKSSSDSDRFRNRTVMLGALGTATYPLITYMQVGIVTRPFGRVPSAEFQGAEAQRKNRPQCVYECARDQRS